VSLGTEQGKCFWAAMKRAVTEADRSTPAAPAAENLPRLFTMFFKGVAEEGCEFVPPLSLVLVVLLGFDRRGARRSARGVGVVRWIRVSLLDTPK
jgi:hypothetical protein